MNSPHAPGASGVTATITESFPIFQPRVAHSSGATMSELANLRKVKGLGWKRERPGLVITDLLKYLVGVFAAQAMKVAHEHCPRPRPTRRIGRRSPGACSRRATNMPLPSDMATPRRVFIAPSSSAEISRRRTTISAGCGRWPPTPRAPNAATVSFEVRPFAQGGAQ